MLPVALKLSPLGNTPLVILQLTGRIPPLAERVAVYPVPVAAQGTVVVVIERVVPDEMFNSELAVADWGCDPESETFTVNQDAPGVFGVPKITAEEEVSPNPGGSNPLLMGHKYGVVPPLACSVAEYVVPTVPPGSDAVKIANGITAVATVRLKILRAVFTGELES